METATALLDCGHPPTPTTGIGTGTAIRPNGRTCCYDCADQAQRDAIATADPGDRVHAYVSWLPGANGDTITSWSGGQLMRRVTFGKPHPWSREVRYLSAVDPDGRVWSGTGAAGMYCQLRLTKQTTR